MNKEVVKLASYDECTGCKACSNACKSGAITFEFDAEGFSYPKVSNDVCVNCGMCEKVCPIGKNTTNVTENAIFYAGVSCDSNILKKSSSGGAFSAIAECIRARNGFVVGCRFDEKMLPIHDIVSPDENYGCFRGSKYIQSDVGDVYRKVKILLDDNQYVLFSGTPCEVAGLQMFLQKDYERLFTVDLVCHGVPSSRLWEKHVAMLENREGKRLYSFSFRAKKHSNNSLYYSYNYGGKRQKHGFARTDAYYAAFLDRNNYRNSCYVCQFANDKRWGDFTIGDYWGVENYHQELNASTGVSVLIENSDKAKMLHNELKEHILLIPTEKQNAIRFNANLVRPTVRPAERDFFYANVDVVGYEKWAEQSIREYKRSKAYYYELLRMIIPKRIKNKIPSGIRKAISGLFVREH